MRRFTFFLAGAAALVLAVPALAQEEKANLARGYDLKVKSGHEAEFQSAMKQQMDWYRQNNETWAWHVWQWETGPEIGSYVFRSPGHSWADMDRRGERAKRARENFMTLVSPHLDGMSGSIGVTLEDVSNWPEDYGEVPMVSVYTYLLHVGKNEEFTYTIKKIHEAIQKTDWPAVYAWGASVSGTEMPMYYLVIPHKNYADMKGPEKPFDKMLEDALGRTEADGLMTMLRECIKEQHSALASFREDLSYMPKPEKTSGR